MSKDKAFTDYAAVYDLIYHDKDYSGECDFIEALFKKYRKLPVKRIIDVAVGTGNHALIFAERGYDVTGSDYSSEMTDLLDKKSKEKNLKITAKGGISMTDLPPPIVPYDAVLCLFSAIDYLSAHGQVEKFLETSKSLLNSDGLLIFDCWNGLACLKDYSPVKVRDVSGNGMRVIRISESTLLPMQNTLEVKFKILVQKQNSDLKEFHELHRMRYYFPREMSELLTKAGYEVLGIHPFKDLINEAKELDWNLTFVARKLYSFT